MKLISWNVNGIRAAYKKGFLEFLEREAPDVLCVQETKAHPEQVEPMLLSPSGYKSEWFSAQKKGYSGVATYGKNGVELISKGIGQEDYDLEGRVVITQHGDLRLYNIYFPNGASKAERHDFKQKFLSDLVKHLEPLVKRGEKIIVTGDYNVAHRDIDVYDPVRLKDESGFLPEEREWFDGFLKLGFVDTFRHFHPERKESFTWWSMIERARPANRGWRIDYFCVTQNLVSRLKRAEILDQQQGSDHCPVLLELSDK